MNIVHERRSYREVIQMPKLIGNIRETIIKEGRTMLQSGNYKNFNIREIAKKCNLGLGTLYNYFSNKDDLVYEIFSSDWNSSLLLVEDLKQSEMQLEDKLKVIYLSLETFLSSYMSIFFEISFEKKEVKNCPQNYYSEIFQRMEELIDVEKTKGSIKSTLPSNKLSIFIVTNMFSCIKGKQMTFDELFMCMKI